MTDTRDSRRSAGNCCASSPPRRIRLARPLAVGIGVLGLFACHSAPPPKPRPAAPGGAPAAAYATPAAPAPTVPPVPPAPAPPQAAPGTAAVAPAEPLDNEAGLAGEGDPAENEGAVAAARQKEALELCQTARQLLDQGDGEAAGAAIDQAYEKMLSLPENHQGAFLQAKQDIRLLVADLINRLYKTRHAGTEEPLGSWDLALKLVDNQYVRREIQSFTTVERDEFVAAVQRSGRWRPMILAKLSAAGLPSQLSWLPLVESLFKERALSRAGAYGLWQFIASTGLRYGLQRDAWIDERLDPEKATDAAIGYLTDLHGMFGDWPKALAGYNCGEANVQRQQSNSNGDYMDFWDVYERLPQETRRYVPRLFAALMILEDPARYGMSLPTPDSPLPPTVTVQVARPLELARLDATLGLVPGTLLGFNPELRERATPARPYALRVPAGSEATLLAGLDEIPTWRPPVPQYATYTVRAGDTLSSIAQRYHTSIGAIQAASGLGRSTHLSIGQRLRLSGRAASPAASSAAGRSAARTDAPPANHVHVVRPGDSLHTIAVRYGTTVELLKAANHLATTLLMPGQELRLP